MEVLWSIISRWVNENGMKYKWLLLLEEEEENQKGMRLFAEVLKIGEMSIYTFSISTSLSEHNIYLMMVVT